MLELMQMGISGLLSLMRKWLKKRRVRLGYKATFNFVEIISAIIYP